LALLRKSAGIVGSARVWARTKTSPGAIVPLRLIVVPALVLPLKKNWSP
jgi:hypothetical protein